MLATAIANAIESGFKFFAQWTKGAERRHLRAAVDAAEKFMNVYYRVGEYENVSEGKRKALLTHYWKKFIAYN